MSCNFFPPFSHHVVLLIIYKMSTLFPYICVAAALLGDAEVLTHIKKPIFTFLVCIWTEIQGKGKIKRIM